MPIIRYSIALGMLICSVLLLSTIVAAQPQSTAVELVIDKQGANKSSQKQSKKLYLLRFKDAPVASYKGGIKGLKATHPRSMNRRKLDTHAPEVQAYKNYLAERHADALATMEQLLGKPVAVEHEYFYASNGMAVWLTDDQARAVAKLPGLVSIEADKSRKLHTDTGPEWIGAPSIWNGSSLPPTQGEGIIIGIIDTGINPSNPSFADVGADGYDHTNPWGKGNYVGVCDPSDQSYDPSFKCNDKLIGARGYPDDDNGEDPRDYDGHGSHTASTAAGNYVEAAVKVPTLQLALPISGVAPHANIVAYAACCRVSSLAAAIDDAIRDGVDVINYSIGSAPTSSAWNEFDSLAFLEAREAGIFVAASTGNDGPGTETISSPAFAPWLSAVAATTHGRIFQNRLHSMSGGASSPPAAMQGQAMSGAYGPASIVHARDYPPFDPLCKQPYPAGTWNNGEIVVCDRGEVARVDKSANVKAGGAGGFVLANSQNEGESLNSDPHSLPAVHIGFNDAERLRNWLANGSNHRASISESVRQIEAESGNIVASFSSRGPNPTLYDVIKPDISAPGVNILAVLGQNDPNPPQWGMESGTSMSSPHLAGAAALVMALHPDWTPGQIRSVLMSTANAQVNNDENAPANPFQQGAGEIDLSAIATQQAGLSLDETRSRYLAANPDQGGDPKQLNIASLSNHLCAGKCSWSRTVTSVAQQTLDWEVSVIDPPGWRITVEPATFTLMAEGKQTLTITAEARQLPTADWKFGAILLSASSDKVHRFPVALSFSADEEPSGYYQVSTSLDDSNCDTGFNGYVNLEDDGLLPDPGLVGDSKTWIAFSEQDPFEFFGKNYQGIAFSDDAYLVFNHEKNDGGNYWIPQALPNSNLPNNLIGALWSDLEIIYDDGSSVGSRVRGITLGKVGSNVSIIEYDDPVLFGSDTSVGDFEVVIYSNVRDQPGKPEIIVAFDNINHQALPDLATIGVENSSGTIASAFLNNADPATVIDDGLMICFDYQENDASCKTHWILENEVVSAQQTYQARTSIQAGNDFIIASGANVSMEVSAGGSAFFYPGFSARKGSHLRVSLSDSGQCSL